MCVDARHDVEQEPDLLDTLFAAQDAMRETEARRAANLPIIELYRTGIVIPEIKTERTTP
jgi:hypothetical protein